MKIKSLSVFVLGTLLFGCGGGDDDNASDAGAGSGGNTPSRPALSATFVDSAVSGLSYYCGNYQGRTDENGVFWFNPDDTCEFKLGSISLGSIALQKGQQLVTPYSIAKNGDKDLAIRIAALLQTMDSDANPSNGITLIKEQVDKLGTVRLDNDEEFFTSLEEVLKTIEVNNNIVSLVQAKAHLVETLAKLNGQSVAVTKIVSDLSQVSDFKLINIENKLTEYRELLDSEVTESGKADRDITRAFLSVMEVTNDPVVAERINFMPSQIGLNYTSNLAKVIDFIIHMPTTAHNILKGEKGHTRDISTLLNQYAQQLSEASAALADIQDPDYHAVYGDNGEFTFNYDQIKALRTSAIAMTSALNIASAYQFGSDKPYITQKESVTLPKIHIRQINNSGTGKLEYNYQEGSDTYDSEFATAEIEPEVLLNDANFFRLTNDAQRKLGMAKAKLTEALQLALTIELAKVDNTLTDNDIMKTRIQLQEYADHMTGKTQSIDVVRKDINNIWDNGSWVHTDDSIVYTLNLLPFFDEMLDRNDIDLNISGGCAMSVGVRDAALSKALNTPACLTTYDEFTTMFTQGGQAPFDREMYDSFFYIDTAHENGGNYSTTYAKGVRYNWRMKISPKVGSTFDKIFLACHDMTENKVNCAEHL